MAFLDNPVLTFSKSVQERLALCAIDMGCNRSWATAPRMKVEREEFPFSYSLLGGVVAPVGQTRGVVRVARNYIQRIFLFPYTGGADFESGGAESNLIATEWADRGYFYYLAHDTLATDTLPALRYCKGVLISPDPGLVVRPAPGGERCACIEYPLTIVMAANLQPFSPPYSEV